MPREYTKVKHLEPVVFQLKAAGKTNSQIAAQLGLTKAQIKGLIKRHNRRQHGEAIAAEPVLEEPYFPPFDDTEPDVAPAGRSGIRTHGEVDDELTRMLQEVNSLEESLKEIDRLWGRIEKKQEP